MLEAVEKRASALRYRRLASSGSRTTEALTARTRQSGSHLGWVWRPASPQYAIISRMGWPKREDVQARLSLRSRPSRCADCLTSTGGVVRGLQRDPSAQDAPAEVSNGVHRQLSATRGVFGRIGATQRPQSVRNRLSLRRPRSLCAISSRSVRAVGIFSTCRRTSSANSYIPFRRSGRLHVHALLGHVLRGTMPRLPPHYHRGQNRGCKRT